ncbi:unnamed protein product [Orchesella dallaii]|uniref:HRDC domain-containing protein n=1 Tax=Orchesella dallaii TaxID=48710 RepID=A0ABP1RNP3_9HEXA
MNAQNVFDSVNSNKQKSSFRTVVHVLTGEQLDKLWTRFPWQMRPIPEGALEYARKDSQLLYIIWRKMKSEYKNFLLFEYNTNDDLNAVIKEYSLIRKFNPENEFKLCQTNSKKDIQLADCLNFEKHHVLFVELFKWSIRTAQLKDLRRNKVLNNNEIVSLTVIHPKTLDEMVNAIPKKENWLRSKNNLVFDSILNVIHKYKNVNTNSLFEFDIDDASDEEVYVFNDTSCDKLAQKSDIVIKPCVEMLDIVDNSVHNRFVEETEDIVDVFCDMDKEITDNHKRIVEFSDFDIDMNDDTPIIENVAHMIVTNNENNECIDSIDDDENVKNTLPTLQTIDIVQSCKDISSSYDNLDISMIDMITDNELLCNDTWYNIRNAKNLKFVINKLSSRRKKLKESVLKMKFRNDPVKREKRKLKRSNYKKTEKLKRLE